MPPLKRIIERIGYNEARRRGEIDVLELKERLRETLMEGELLDVERKKRVKGIF